MTSKVVWIFRITVSAILLQTLFFKFTAAPESVYIFDTLGAGAIGRIGSGIVELVFALLIVYPKFTKLGSLGAAGTMLGAIMSHIFVLGIEVQGDGGLLFALATTTLICSILNFIMTKEKFEILNIKI